MNRDVNNQKEDAPSSQKLDVIPATMGKSNQPRLRSSALIQ